MNLNTHHAPEIDQAAPTEEVLLSCLSPVCLEVQGLRTPAPFPFPDPLDPPTGGRPPDAAPAPLPAGEGTRTRVPPPPVDTCRRNETQIRVCDSGSAKVRETKHKYESASGSAKVGEGTHTYECASGSAKECRPQLRHSWGSVSVCLNDSPPLLWPKSCKPSWLSRLWDAKPLETTQALTHPGRRNTLFDSQSSGRLLTHTECIPASPAMIAGQIYSITYKKWKLLSADVTHGLSPGFTYPDFAKYWADLCPCPQLCPLSTRVDCDA